MTDVPSAVQAAKDMGATPIVAVGSNFLGMQASKATAYGVWTAVIGLITTWIIGTLKNRVPLRKIDVERDDRERGDVFARMDRMQLDHDKEKDLLVRRVESLETRLDSMRDKHQAETEALRKESDRKERLVRHELANTKQCLDAVLLLLEANADDPERVREAVRLVRDMRDRQRDSEYLEKGASAGATAAAAAIRADRFGPEASD